MESILTRYARGGFSQARSIIGGESLTISGGPSVSCVLNESADNREYEDAGFDRSTTLDAVIRDDEFKAAYPNALSSYIGKVAETRGVNFRIMGTSTRPGITVLQLSDTRKGR
jgi:hypothetical protein